MGVAPRRGRRIAAIAVSAVVHLALLALVATRVPTLVIPIEPGGPPEPVIPLLLMPRLPPAAAAAPGAQPRAIRLHRRVLRPLPPSLPVAPLPAPEAPAQPAKPAPAPAAAPPRSAPLPEGPREQLSAALRRSSIGCANPTAAGLTREERETCDARFGSGAKGAAYLPADAGLSPEKRSVLQGAAARRDADFRYRRGGVPPGVFDATTAEGLGRALGNDRSKATAPF
jgi:hypothetical protein